MSNEFPSGYPAPTAPSAVSQSLPRSPMPAPPPYPPPTITSVAHAQCHVDQNSVYMPSQRLNNTCNAYLPPTATTPLQHLPQYPPPYMNQHTSTPYTPIQAHSNAGCQQSSLQPAVIAPYPPPYLVQPRQSSVIPGYGQNTQSGIPQGYPVYHPEYPPNPPPPLRQPPPPPPQPQQQPNPNPYNPPYSVDNPSSLHTGTYMRPCSQLQPQPQGTHNNSSFNIPPKAHTNITRLSGCYKCHGHGDVKKPYKPCKVCGRMVSPTYVMNKYVGGCSKYLKKL